MRKMMGLGFLNDGDNVYLILQDEPKIPTHTAAILSVMDLYVAKRFFVEKNENGVLDGVEVFVSPHWKSLYGDYPCTIDWLPEPREFDVVESTVVSETELDPPLEDHWYHDNPNY